MVKEKQTGLYQYVRSADDQMKFVESVERGWYEIHSGLGETVMEADNFFESVKQELRSDNQK